VAVQAYIMMCSSCLNSTSRGGGGDYDENTKKKNTQIKKDAIKKWVRKCSSLKSSSQL